jgi:hypothetical protein
MGPNYAEANLKEKCAFFCTAFSPKEMRTFIPALNPVGSTLLSPFWHLAIYRQDVK